MACSASFLRTRSRARRARGASSPRRPSLATEHARRCPRALVSRRCSRPSRGCLARLRWLQHGRVQLYVLYIALALLVLLVWKLG